MSDAASTIREALNAGLNAQALDLARGAAAGNVADPEIDYLAALASARLGAVAEAERRLAEIDRDSLGASPLAVEVWSLAGRIAKDRYAAVADRTSAAAHDFAQTAIADYEHAHALGGGAYSAVNAATMAMLAGDALRANRLATQALATAGAAGDHWHHATAA